MAWQCYFLVISRSLSPFSYLTLSTAADMYFRFPYLRIPSLLLTFSVLAFSVATAGY